MTNLRLNQEFEDRLAIFEDRLIKRLELQISNSHAISQADAESEEPYYVTGTPEITFDDCTVMKFDCGGPGGKWGFQKAGKDSWVETVKYAHREGTDIRICTNFNSLETDPDLPYLPVSVTPA